MRTMNASKQISALLTVSTLSVLVTATTYAQNLVVDGSFETVISNNHLTSNPGTWHLGQTFAGAWTVSLNNIHIIKMPVPFSYMPVSAYHGDQYLDVNGMGGKGALYQNLTVSAPGMYKLQFALNGVYGGSFPKTWRKINVTLTDTSTTTQVFNSDYVHNYNSLFSATNQPWDVITTNITLYSAGVYRLQFADFGFTSTEAGPVIDDVSFQLVPEPASMIALGTGLASLLGLRRRKR